MKSKLLIGAALVALTTAALVFANNAKSPAKKSVSGTDDCCEIDAKGAPKTEAAKPAAEHGK